MPSMNSTAAGPSGLVQIDKQLAALEENISKLKASLRYWQTWEIDYEGLREEFERLNDDCTDQEIQAAARESNPEAVDEKEIDTLIASCSTSKKRKSQLVDRLAKRVDYVVRNASTVQNQLSEAQKKRNAMLLAERSDLQDQAALPLSEITEQLADDGKVISSSVQTPKDTAPRLAQVLHEAGLEELGISGGRLESFTDKSERRPQGHDANANVTEIMSAPRASDSTKSLSVETPSAGATAESKGSDAAMELESNPSSPIVQVDESPADAFLRREMLEYTPDDVGAVVAQLEIDDNSDDIDSDASIHDFMDEDDLQVDDSEDSDALDDTGRSLKSLLTDEYRQEMMALERKLNAGSMQNIGPTRKDFAEKLEPASITQTTGDANLSVDQKASTTKTKKPPKKVAFAKNLDIAPPILRKAADAESDHQASKHPQAPIAPEHARQDATTIPSRNKARVSKFKASRSANTQASNSPNPSIHSPLSDQKSVSSGFSKDEIQSDIVVERPSGFSRSGAKPPSSDEIDISLHQKEIKGEFRKMRNHIIQQQGGFTEELDPQEEVPLEDKTGKKISRFRAARMK